MSAPPKLPDPVPDFTGSAPVDMPGSRYQVNGYRAARVERSRSGADRSRPGSGDRFLRNDRATLIQIADRLQRDSGIYGGVLTRFVEAVFGADGFQLDPRTGSKKLDKVIKDRWSRFSEDCDTRGIFHWRDAEAMALRSLCNHGDVAAIHTVDDGVGRFQFVEAEEIAGGTANKGNTMEQGVELNANGRPMAFHVSPRSSGYVSPGQATRIPADVITFMAHRERFSQTRGVPVLSTAFSMIHRVTDVVDSEAIAWQTASKFAMAIERDRGPEVAYGESSAKTTTDADRMADRFMEMDEATMVHLDKGEKIHTIDRNVPGKDFTSSVRMFLRLIGLPLGLPLEVILLDYTQTNYSSARAALEQAYRSFVRWQEFLIRHWHRPLYLRWLKWEMEAGHIRSPLKKADPTRHAWITPRFPWVDHLKEAQAWGARLDRGLATQGEALRSTGTDLDDFREVRADELTTAMEEAERIAKTFPWVSKDWLARTLSGVQASVNGFTEEAPQEAAANQGPTT